MGHFGVALLGKGARPRIPFWMLVGAVFVVDLLSAGFKIAGFAEPFIQGAKSGAIVAGLAFVFGGAYAALRGDRRGGALLALCTLSHTPLDALTNKAALWPGGPLVGWRLYDYPAWDFAAEAALLVAGWLLYRRTLPPAARRSWAAWALLLSLLSFQAAFSLRTAGVVELF